VPEFVGAQAGASCHRQMYDTWQSGRHSRMLQPATASSVVGDFSKSSITLHGNRFQLRTANGEFYIAESYLTGKLQEHRVEHTLGSRRIQHYLTTIDKGWIVVLPPSWDVQRREWFDNMDIVRPGRTTGTPIQQWNKDCVGCHVSGEEKNYRQASRDYRTRWTDFGTSCERCHGPGSAHVEAYSRAQVARPAERSIVKPTRLDPQRSSMICAQCHSLRNVVHPGYKAGDEYFDFFTPRLEYDPGSDRELPYWPDGRPRRFSNDAIGLWQSACFLRGGATCTTCHRDPHLPNVDRSPQLAPANNALCTQCHDAIGRQLASHTRHAADSAGSSCVECHMPKTVISLNSTMRDHTLSLPTPENTVALNIPNACNECHTQNTPVWAVNVLNAWYPNGRRARLVRQAEAFTAARSKKPEGLDRLLALAADDSVPPLIQATAVGYLRNYSNERARQALLVAAKSEQPAVRVAAISSLGYQPALVDTVVRSVLVAALDDPRRAIRISALISLINVNASGNPLGTVDGERLRRVGHEYAALSPLYEDDAGFDRDLGVVHLLTGEFDRAADVLQICLAIEPNRPSARFLLAFARLGQRRIDEARALLKQVQPSDPMYDAAQRRLKSLTPGAQ
jgi:predicted CXXCH cytochrome family protein